MSCEITGDKLIIRYDASQKEEAGYRMDGDTMTVTWEDGRISSLTLQGGKP